ncbi:MAG TPA: penicillin-binding protein 2 [Gammaproteobacteria bacterium]|nr:penicillin-binding protein 2 [Gammaproteobacteria bacterium]
MARLNPLPIKDHLRETLLFNRRMLVAGVVVLLLISVLMGRLAQLQILEHEHYTTLSENNRVSIRPLVPTRGLIYDRNGVLLAQNLPSFRLEIVPERVENMEQTLAELATLVRITDEDLARFHEQLKVTHRFEGVPLRFRLTDEEVARIAARRHRLPGVFINADLARHYPLGELTAHAVGYVGRISIEELRTLDPSNYRGSHYIGKVGIEKYYEDILHGQVGHQRVETNAQARVLRKMDRTLPVPGQTLYLNLDARLQLAAQQAFGEENGALVAIDPRTGAVLALVSMPTYDPNLFVNGLDSTTYKALRDSPNRPLFNRALQGQYPPGSTIKPFMGLAGLELKVTDPQREVNCPGWYMLKNDERRYRDWKKGGHGDVDLDRAIVESCDVYFYDLAFELGIDRIHSYLSRFGLGQRTGIDIRGELPGLLPSREWKKATYNQRWYHGETLITGIGQGFTLTTPLQLASATATLASRGRHMRPTLVRSIQHPGAENVIPLEPRQFEPVIIHQQKNWDLIIRSMKRVVHSIYGTARRINVNLTYTIAGKTGTAQVFGIKQDEEYVAEDIQKRLRDHALFIAFAPVEDPRIAVAVIVENGGSGGAVAAPIARKVMDAFLVKAQ